jgi:8-oxo-dGTP pyrophosphatase MutT (NUDIX family)
MLPSDPFELVSSATVYQNPWIEVEHQEVIRPDGNLGIYGIVHFKNRAVAILPIEANGDVWLIGQWRRPTDSWSWEIPEGGVPYDEDLEIGARRELEEEAGVTAGSLIKVLEFDVSNSICDEVGYSYIAYDLSLGQCAPDPTEILSLRRLHFTELLVEIDMGLIRDALTLVTVMRVHQLACMGKLPATLCEAMLVKKSGF